MQTLAVPALAVTRIFIIETQVLFAKALAQVLSIDSSIQVIGDASSINEAVLKRAHPDLLLIDIDGKDIDLIELIHDARRSLPDVRTCALSMHVAPEVMQRALTAGADGFLVKDLTPNEFLRAIKSVASGETYVDPRVAGKLLRRRTSTNSYPDLCDLSTREMEVVRLIVGGLSNKEISTKLLLSEKTIKNHVSRIFTKFNCTARTQAAVMAIRSGLV